MNFVFIVKRYYTNKDLIEDRFGRLFHFPVHLSKLGHKCSVFALSFKSQKVIDTSICNVRFVSIPLWKLPLYLFKSVKYRGKVDVTFSSGDSYFGFLGLWLARLWNSFSVFDMYDDYSTFKTNSIPFMKKILYYTVNKSDLLLGASPAIANQYKNYLNRSFVIPNGIDPEVFKPISKQQARLSSEINQDIQVIGYFGSIHTPRGVDLLIKAVQELRNTNENLTLLLAGHLSKDIDIKHSWINYKGMVSQTKVVELINCCDVVVLPYRNTPMIQMTNACKLSEYCACGIPIVVTDVADYKSYCPSQHCIAEAGNVESLAKAIQYQLINKTLFPITKEFYWQNIGEQLNFLIKTERDNLKKLN